MLERLTTFVVGLYQEYLKKKQIEPDAQKSMEPLKNAKTGEEIEKATDPAVDGF